MSNNDLYINRFSFIYKTFSIYIEIENDLYINHNLLKAFSWGDKNRGTRRIQEKIRRVPYVSGELSKDYTALLLIE